MKNKLPYIFLFLLLSLGVYVYFTKKSGHDQEVERLLIENQRLRIEADSSKAKAERWRLTALQYGNQFRSEATRAQKAEANYLNEKAINEILKKRPVVRYTDTSLDSLFLARYGR